MDIDLQSTSLFNSSMPNLNDCEKCIGAFFQYEKEVIEGKIVQSFYYLSAKKDTFDIDSKLDKLARESFGIPTGENGIYNGERRDVDFKFDNTNQANEFKLKLLLHGFYYHSQLNRSGELKDMPSVIEIQNSIQEAIKLNCN
jgi:hypothetical protein